MASGSTQKNLRNKYLKRVVRGKITTRSFFAFRFFSRFSQGRGKSEKRPKAANRLAKVVIGAIVAAGGGYVRIAMNQKCAGHELTHKCTHDPECPTPDQAAR